MLGSREESVSPAVHPTRGTPVQQGSTATPASATTVWGQQIFNTPSMQLGTILALVYLSIRAINQKLYISAPNQKLNLIVQK